MNITTKLKLVGFLEYIANARETGQFDLQSSAGEAKELLGAIRNAPELLLHELATKLNGAYISNWQSTHEWPDQLDAAIEYLQRAKQ